eukprot:gnl/TRDRNA2_/TRDRNA2_50703_c0_seq1.p1 gnl/TRDRNA2_/TRDRNA2_50703_c0~~gnl/TRDRNA2_/TRDRNA2_50703_c0_seq1.p1  ORF type:complete len:280 (-),score=55.11 gnl/TRDRNA2_/TRDRNA2_50703_c0_seq1:86-925(-)
MSYEAYASSTTAPPPQWEAVSDSHFDSEAGYVATTTVPVLVAKEVGCQVLAGTTGKMVQVLLFACVCATLFYKFKRNAGGRSLYEFLMDSSKQIAGATWTHMMNLFFALHLEAYFEGQGDQCEWYWVNIMVDCSIGVVVQYVLLLVSTSLVQKHLPEHADDLKTGEYKNSDDSLNWNKYFKQLLMWLAIVSAMKLIMVIIMMIGHGMFIQVAGLVLAPVTAAPTLELLVVMILTPFIMNSVQFWTTDNFIRKRGDPADPRGDMETDGGMVTRIRHDGDL